MKNFEITREIGIDMAHRVTHHGSKCRNLHGHRYTIQATCCGQLAEDGEQQGMVLDFGFLKQIMMEEIDLPCDHGLCLWIQDPWVDIIARDRLFHESSIVRNGYSHVERMFDNANTGGKFYIVPFVPTAENLAKHWFERMLTPVADASGGKARLSRVRVYETPNCWSDYPA